MTTEQNNEWGDIPQGWEVKRIGDFTDCTAGGTPSTSISAYWGGNIAWMSSGELHLKRVYDVEGRITQLGLENSSTKFVPVNSVLIGLAGQGKTRGTVAISKIPLCTNQSIASIFPNDEFDAEFLFYNLENRYDELRSLSTGDGGRGGLNLTIIRNINIQLPPKPEQTAIATVLSDTDKLIDSLTALIAKKQAIKSATMSQLLSGQKRLSEFANHSDGTPKTYIQTDNGKIPEDWEIVALGDLANLYQPETISLSHLQISGYPVYGANGIIGFYKDYNHIEPQVMVTCRGSTCGTVNMSVAYSWITGNAMVVNPNNRISKKFMYYLLSYQDLSVCITGSGQPQIVRTPLANFKVKIPKSTTEQTAIAQILSDMDSEIIALENRLNKTKALKQGLMHQLLTGKIRLI